MSYKTAPRTPWSSRIWRNHDASRAESSKVSALHREDVARALQHPHLPLCRLVVKTRFAQRHESTHLSRRTLALSHRPQLARTDSGVAVHDGPLRAGVSTPSSHEPAFGQWVARRKSACSRSDERAITGQAQTFGLRKLPCARCAITAQSARESRRPCWPHCAR